MLDSLQKLHAGQKSTEEAGQAALSDLEVRLAATVLTIEDLRRASHTLESDRNSLQSQVNQLLASRTWRVTARLRALKSAWLRLMKTS